jgi:hypothetical protein
MILIRIIRARAVAGMRRVDQAVAKPRAGGGAGGLAGDMTVLTTPTVAVRWLGVGAVTLGIFAIVTTEILPRVVSSFFAARFFHRHRFRAQHRQFEH